MAKENFVRIRATHVEYGFHVFYKREGELIVGYIPSFNMMFNAKNAIEADERALNKVSALIRSYSNDMHGLLEDLKRLGFKNNNPAQNAYYLRAGKGSYGKMVALPKEPDEVMGFDPPKYIDTEIAA